MVLSNFIYTGNATPVVGADADKLFVCVGSKYNISPTLPGSVGSFDTILPTGLILRLPVLGVLTEVTIPAILSISDWLLVVTFINTPLELIFTKSPSSNELYKVEFGSIAKKSVK